MDIFATLVKQVLHRRKPTPLASPHPSNRVWSNLISTDELWRSRMLPGKIMTEGFGQIWGLYRSGKQIKPDLPHLCNGEREQCFITSLNQTSPTNLPGNRATEVLRQSNDIFGQTSDFLDVVTITLPPPSTLTPTPPAPARRSMPSTMTPASTPMFKQPPLGLPMGMATGETLILMDCFLGMGLAVPGPKRFRHRPVYEFKDSGPLRCLKPSPIIGDPNYYLQKPRSVLIFSLLNPSQVRSRSLETFARRLQMKQDGSLLLWLIKTSLRTLPLASPRIGYHLEEDWKKSQVDSKKILAQPHQSFKSLSFSFFPRSEISFVDDLAKKAVRSMTTGLSMFL